MTRYPMGQNAGQDQVAGISQALASIENRISTLAGQPQQAAPQLVHGQGGLTQMTTAAYGAQTHGGQPHGGQAHGEAHGQAHGQAPAEISQLRTTISRLTDQINAQVAANGGASMPRSAVQALPPVGGSQGLPPHAPLSSLAAQVAERKRVLAEEAERRAAQPVPQAVAQPAPQPAPAMTAEAPAPRPAPQPMQQTTQQPLRPRASVTRHTVTERPERPERPAPQPDYGTPERNTTQPSQTQPSTPDTVAARGNRAVRELSAKLDTIKTDLVGMKRALQRQAEQQAQAQTETQTKAEGVPQAEIERIASGIAALQEAPTFDPSGFDRLGDEISRLRQNMRGELRDTVRNEVAPAIDEAVAKAQAQTNSDTGAVEQAVERLSREIEAVAGAGARDAGAKVEELSAQFAALRGVVDDLPNTLAINRLEAKLREVAERVESAVESAVAEPTQAAPSHFELEGFAQIESRLDEITRALVAVGMGTEAARMDPVAVDLSGVDLSGVERLEARMGDLMGRVEALAAAQDEAAQAQAVAQAEALRAQEEAQRELREASELEAVTQHLVQLSERLTQIEHHAETSSRAAARALDRTPDLSGLEAQLMRLASQLEASADADTTQHQLAGLEAQIAGLASSLGAMDAMGLDLSPVEMRLAEIENSFDRHTDTLSQSFEAAQERLAVAAAQNAAAQVAETLGAHTQDGRTMAALAAELGAVQSALESSDNRSAETLDAVRRTLDAVMERLGAVESGMARQSGHLEQVVAKLMAQPAQAAAINAPHVAYADPVATPAKPAAPAMPAAAQLHETRFATTPPPLDPGDVFGDADEGYGDFADADDASSLDAAAADLAADRPIEPGQAPRNVGDRPDIASIVRDATARLNSSAARQPADETMSGQAAVDAFNAANAHTDQRAEPRADETPEVVAAARRAVLSSRQELEEGSGLLGSLKDGAGSLGDAVRKPLVMAAGAVVLAAALAYAGWTQFVAPRLDDAPRAPAISAIEAPVMADTASADLPVAAADATADARQSAPRPVRAVSIEAPADTPARDAALPTPSVEASPIIDTQVTEASVADDTTRTRYTVPITDAPAANAPGVESATTPVAAPAVEPAAETTAGRATPAVPVAIEEGPLRAAAKAGDRLALHEIGVRYSDGVGVPRDMQEAARWFGLAAERGFAPSQYSLGSLYEKGIGVERDVERAKALYRQAADKGNARAMHNLAVVHAMGGEGREADLPSATRWFLEGASLGVKDSQFNLGILYGQGMGVPQNFAESYKWFAVAARTGDKDAIAKRDEVAAVMDAEALKRAKATAEAWRAETPDRAANSTAVPGPWRSAVVASASGSASGSASSGPAVVTDVSAVKRAQGLLNRIGFTVGKPDGKAGPRTGKAVAAFQRTWSLPPTGKLDKRTLAALEDANT